MKHVRAWALAWVVLWWLWVLLAGEWNRAEWIAAAGAATIAATLGEIARTRAGELERDEPVDRAAAHRNRAERNESREERGRGDQERVHAGSSDLRYVTRSWRSTSFRSGSISTT